MPAAGGPGLCGVATGHGAAAQPDQCVSLIPGTADGSGQCQSLLVTFHSLRDVTPDPVQRPLLIERRGLGDPAAKVAEDPQGLLQGLGRAWIISCPSPRDPEPHEGGGLAEPVTEVMVNVQGLLQNPSSTLVTTGRPRPAAEVEEGVGWPSRSPRSRYISRAFTLIRHLTG